MGTKPSKSKSASGPTSSTDPSPSKSGRKTSKKDGKGKGASSDSAMPFFGHKQSEAGRKKEQHKVYLAQVSPEPTIDVAECESIEVPSGIFSMCQVLRKEALLLHTNWLTSLKEGGSILDLSNVRVLDLHSNLLTSLPDEICQLTQLQVLNVEKNRLTKLPANLGNLRSLQNLNVKSNRIKDLPDSITKLRCLRSLDISDNRITHLPRELCHIRPLESLILDSDHMIYPNPEICTQGTESIMRLLCSDCGIEYITPSSVVLDVLEPPKVTSPTMVTGALKALAEDVKLMTSFDQYAAQQERKRLEMIELEREFESHNLQQAELAAVSAADKRVLVNKLAAEEEKMVEELNTLTQRKEQARQQLVASIHDVEMGAAELMVQLLKVNEKARKTELLIEQMEKDRIKQEEWFIVRQEESELLRKQEVLVAMERILEENSNFDAVWKTFQADKDLFTKNAMKTESETSDRVNLALKEKRIEHDEMCDLLAKQEKLQKEAFEALQLQKDARHTRLTSEIDLIQEELAQLSKVEMEKQEERKEITKNILTEKRIALTGMMMQLIEEREVRAQELKHRMREMEQRREDGQMDYWIVQYQRLMDRKPQQLIDKEKQLEIAVIKILEQADAADYIPLFSRHRITIETMLQLSNQEIQQMGVHEMGLRKSILRKIEEYKAKYRSTASQGPVEQLPPTAPPRAEIETPSGDLKARGVDSECCICMERKSAVIFLPCGHVCTCEVCTSTVQECPLCRTGIVQRITLFA